MRKTKNLVIAFFALFILASGYFYSTLRGKKTDSSSSSFTPPVTLGNLESSELVKIEMPSFTLEKNNGVWELAFYDGKILPGGFELDQDRIWTLTYSLANLWTERLVEERPGDLSVYGFDNPTVWTAITDSAGRRAKYSLGSMTPSRTS